MNESDKGMEIAQLARGCAHGQLPAGADCPVCRMPGVGGTSGVDLLAALAKRGAVVQLPPPKPAGATVLEVIHEEAAKAGRSVADGEAEYVLWEFTGYPCFWPDAAKTPEENLRAQLAEYFADPKAAHERQEAEERAMLEAFGTAP